MIISWQLPVWEHLFAKPLSLPHALLLCGRSGIGKFAFARLVSKALLCENPRANFTPCGACTACHWFDQDSHPDFRLLQPGAYSASEPGEEGEGRDLDREKRQRAKISVEQVRGLAGFVSLTTHRKGKKVVLLSPAEDLNASAANALLKTLEEPPPETVFLLVSHRPRQVLATIRSRCRILSMPVPSATEGLAWLAEQGAAEPLLALTEAGFAPLKALENAQGSHFERRKAFLETLARGQLMSPILEATALGPTDLVHLLAWLQKWTYDLSALRFAGRIRYNPDFAERLGQIAVDADVVRLARLNRSLLDEQAALKHALNPRLVLERVLIDYARCVRSGGTRAW